VPRLAITIADAPTFENVALDDIVHVGVSRPLSEVCACRYKNIGQMAMRGILAWPEGSDPILNRAFGGKPDEVRGVVGSAKTS